MKHVRNLTEKNVLLGNNPDIIRNVILLLFLTNHWIYYESIFSISRIVMSFVCKIKYDNRKNFNFNCWEGDGFDDRPKQRHS